MRSIFGLTWLLELPARFDDALDWDDDMLLELDDDPGAPDWTGPAGLSPQRRVA